MQRRASNGFTLIELLVVVAILGIIAAVAIPQLIAALDRGKQKRTIADLRSIGSAVTAYSIDHDSYPAATDLAQLATHLEPQYIRKIPSDDGWNHGFIYTSDPTTFTVGSTGKDGGTSLTLLGSGGPTSNFEDDIILTGGNFVQWPEGFQE